jgi:hypothetical protein
VFKREVLVGRGDQWFRYGAPKRVFRWEKPVSAQKVPCAECRTPVAAAVASTDVGVRKQIGATVMQQLLSYPDHDGITYPEETHVVTALGYHIATEFRFWPCRHVRRILRRCGNQLSQSRLGGKAE